MNPNKFKVAGFEIEVLLMDGLDDYGEFCDVTNTIKLAKSIRLDNGDVIPLTRRQIQNTFYHELIHAFQFYYDTDSSESEAQVFANFLLEYNESSEGMVES
jgi:hypothetical protein